MPKREKFGIKGNLFFENIPKEPSVLLINDIKIPGPYDMG